MKNKCQFLTLLGVCSLFSPHVLSTNYDDFYENPDDHPTQFVSSSNYVVDVKEITTMDVKEIEEEIKEILQALPDSQRVEVENEIGEFLFKEGKLLEAKQYFKAAAQHDDPRAHYNLALILYKEGDRKGARDHIEKAAHQGIARAQYNFASLLFKEGKQEEGRKWIEKSAAQGDTEAQYTLGCYLSQENSTKEAEQSFKAAAEKGHSRALIRFRDILIKERRYPEFLKWDDKRKKQKK